MEHFSTNFPSKDSNELKFVLSLCGTLTNILAHPKGRDSLLTLQHSETLINNTLQFMGDLQGSNGKVLKKYDNRYKQRVDEDELIPFLFYRMFLLIILNTCNNHEGMSYILKNKIALATIVDCVKLTDENSRENKDFGLRIFWFILKNVNEIDLFRTIKGLISIQYLQTIIEANSGSSQKSAQKIVQLYKTLENQFGPNEVEVEQPPNRESIDKTMS